MSGIGIDVQSSQTQIMLREGDGSAARLRSVGDGVRDVIAHIAAGDLVGERAARALGPKAAYAEPEALWRALRTRVSAYLGRLQPTRANGFSVCIALQSEDYENKSAALGGVLSAAGWDAPIIVPATHALAAAVRLDPGARRRVAALAVGEAITSLHVFDVEQGADAPIVTELDAALHLDIGARDWEQEIRAVVTRRMRRAPPDDLGFALAFKAAAMEFGVSLGRAHPDQQVPWCGPMADDAFLDIALAPGDCTKWSSVRRLAAFIEERLASARFDLIVIGGVGAAWPFATQTCLGRAPIWKSGAPWEEIARGAARFSGDAAQSEVFALAPSAASLRRAKSTVHEPATSEDVTPPWLRRGAEEDQ